MRIPPGTGLLLAGSGLYWVLAGPLIGWVSVLNPTQIHLSQMGLTLILITGIACLVLGLWIIPTDLEELARLFSRNDGWIFIIPLAFVASAVQIGPWAVVPFVVSYMALSEGLALGMLSIGKWLFGVARQSRFMPFALICGAASFGPVSNSELLVLPGAGPAGYSVGMISGMIGISAGVYLHFRQLKR